MRISKIFTLKYSKAYSVIIGCFTLVMSSCTYDKAEAPLPIETDPIISYKQEIQPIIANNCYSCHSATASDPEKAGYAYLDNFQELKMYALKPSTTNASYTKLQARLRFIEFPGMPLKKPPLSESDIQKIDAWIKAGAPDN